MGNKTVAISKTKLHKRIRKDNYFHVVDGQTIKGLKDLALVMEHLADEVFNHHVSDNKNDFAAWIKHVVQDEKLAEELMKSFDKEGHQKIIFRHIVKSYVS